MINIDRLTKIELIRAPEKITNSHIRTICDEYWDKPENECSGGNFHIFLEDGNTEENHIFSCLKSACENNDIDGILLGLILLSVQQERRDPYN